jgi:alpha-amylase
MTAPFDAKRNKNKETTANIYFRLEYYGDESARSLVIEGTQGDATLRSL